LIIAEGRVGILLDETPESLEGLGIEDGWLPSGVGPGLDRAGLATELEQSSDTRDVDGEPSGDLAARSLMVVDGGEDSLAKIVR
jgi:hypothetical protein